MSISNKSLVSVIIPTYKRDSILRAIDSVLLQDYPNIEIIVVDDNAEHLEYRKKVEESLSELIASEKVKLVQNEKNLGGSLARNEGILASSGEYIAFLDDDDWYLPNKISKQVDVLENSDSALVYCWCRGEDKNGNVVWENKTSYEGNILIQAMTGCVANTSLIMCKREVLFDVGLFEDMPCKQDVFVELKLATKGYTFACVKEILVVYGNSDDDFQRISNVSNKTIIGLKKVRELARQNYHQITKKQITFVEGDTAYKICGIAKRIGDKDTYKSEMKIALKYLRNWKRVARIIYDFLFWKRG